MTNVRETLNGGHTPGPWEFWPSMDAIPHSVVGPATWRVPGAKVAKIVDVHHYGSSDSRFSSEQESNARLIAAAPEMSNVVDMVIALIEPACTVENDVYGDDPERNEQFANMLRAAWAAKAKATGEEQ